MTGCLHLDHAKLRFLKRSERSVEVISLSLIDQSALRQSASGDRISLHGIDTVDVDHWSRYGRQ